MMRCDFAASSFDEFHFLGSVRLQTDVFLISFRQVYSKYDKAKEIKYTFEL